MTKQISDRTIERTGALGRIFAIGFAITATLSAILDITVSLLG